MPYHTIYPLKYLIGPLAPLLTKIPHVFNVQNSAIGTSPNSAIGVKWHHLPIKILNVYCPGQGIGLISLIKIHHMFGAHDRIIDIFFSPLVIGAKGTVFSQKYLFIYCPVLGIGTFLPFDIDAQDNRDNLFRFDYWCQRAPSTPKYTCSFGAQDRAIGTFSPQRLVTKTGPLVRFPLR